MSLHMEEQEICSEIVNLVQTPIYCSGLGARGPWPCADLTEKQLALFSDRMKTTGLVIFQSVQNEVFKLLS